MEIQVGLLGLARTLQQDLDRIAEDADTTTTKGLHNILTGNVSIVHSLMCLFERAKLYVLS